MTHIAIIGATSAIAHHCARQWVEAQPCQISLVGRNADKIKVIADDLQARNPDARVHIDIVDFTSPDAINHLVEDLEKRAAIDIALIAQGSLPEQSHCQSNLHLIADAIDINATSPVLFAESLVASMLKAGHGKIGIIGSVAGDRGRKSNYVYGAAKGLVSRYAEGLQHRLSDTGVTVTLIKPGPTLTPMTANLDMDRDKLADPAKVAIDIVCAIDSGKQVVYTPAKWKLIMMVIRHLPRFVFNKMDI